MYGVIFDFLRQYVIERHGGKETWYALLEANNYPKYKIFFPVTEYKDEEIVGLAKSAAKALDLPLPTVLEDFGSFVGPKLLSFYHMYVKGENWKTFDVIASAGENIHDAIHRHNNQRKPPDLTARYVSNDELIINYKSDRKLCAVVKGIVRGMGQHFKESFNISETQCMHQGADKCVIVVRRNTE